MTAVEMQINSNAKFSPAMQIRGHRLVLGLLA